ncbi:MAG: class I SAM-dependent methyltransferase [Candidatus Competibacteraceae bacterium]|nr:class I SAM-dependent methyltransferase [Candidatus Competibacteraceae bacterium]
MKPRDPLFELNFYTVYRRYVFEKFLAEFENVFEFGCGTGYNLALLHETYPEKHIIGLDWTAASVEIANMLGSTTSDHISGHRFDYFAPDYSITIPEKSAIITFNSLEQVGSDYQPFLEFLLEKRPALCVNSEPILELYDQANLMDYVAARYHRQRNYLTGYYPEIRHLAEEGKVRILKDQRVQLGNQYHDGYSLLIWQIL